MTKAAPIAEFTQGIPTMGGLLWLDLLNSQLVWNGEPVDHLAQADAFQHWVGVLGLEPSQDWDGERRDLVALRQIISSAFDDVAQGSEPAHGIMDHINKLLARLSVTPQLHGGGAGIHLHHDRTITGRQLPVLFAESFAQSLAEGDPTRLKHCENPRCSMVFHDFGRNNRRRWCSTTICGNRDKVARYRQRKAAQD